MFPYLYGDKDLKNITFMIFICAQVAKKMEALLA